MSYRVYFFAITLLFMNKQIFGADNIVKNEEQPYSEKVLLSEMGSSLVDNQRILELINQGAYDSCLDKAFRGAQDRREKDVITAIIDRWMIVKGQNVKGCALLEYAIDYELPIQILLDHSQINLDYDVHDDKKKLEEWMGSWKKIDEFILKLINLGKYDSFIDDVYFHAIGRRGKEVVTALISRTKNINGTKDRNGKRSPLIHAVSSRNWDAIQVILDHPEIDLEFAEEELLSLIRNKKSEEFVIKLINQGKYDCCLSKALATIIHVDYNHWSEIADGLDIKKYNLVRALLDRGANVNYTGSGKSMLDSVIEDKNWTIVKKLLLDYPKIISNLPREKLLNWMKSSDQIDRFICLLINAGAYDSCLNEALSLSYVQRKSWVISALIKRGADVNSLNEEGYCQLYLAALPDNIAAINLLLSNGAKEELYMKQSTLGETLSQTYNGQKK